MANKTVMPGYRMKKGYNFKKKFQCKKGIEHITEIRKCNRCDEMFLGYAYYHTCKECRSSDGYIMDSRYDDFRIII